MDGRPARSADLAAHIRSQMYDPVYPSYARDCLRADRRTPFQPPSIIHSQEDGKEIQVVLPDFCTNHVFRRRNASK